MAAPPSSRPRRWHSTWGDRAAATDQPGPLRLGASGPVLNDRTLDRTTARDHGRIPLNLPEAVNKV
jgi:hypothetical protein